MRHIRARLGVVAAAVLLLQVGSAAVSSLSACCDDRRSHARPAGASMRCCLKSGTGHLCVLMRGQQPVPSGELRATCANGHDEGVPRGGAPAIAVRSVVLTIEWQSSTIGECVIDPIWRPLASLSPPPRA